MLTEAAQGCGCNAGCKVRCDLTDRYTDLASYPGDLLPPPHVHAPYVLIMSRWFFGGRRPGRFHYVMHH